MKKKLVCVLLACTILSCSACGQSEKVEKKDVTIEEIPETESGDLTSQENTDNSEASETPSEETTQDDSCNLEQSTIQIEMQTVEDKITDEDGTVLLIKSATYPVVTITDNEAAADKINADIQANLDAFHADTSTADYAKEDRQFRLEMEDDSFLEYTEDITYEAARSDTNVISFKTTYSSYTGGAHGSYGSEGINYSAVTGEVISFSDLTDDVEKFHADTLAYNQMLAATDAYSERFYSPDAVTSDDLEATLYADNKWYLSTAGLIFISDPYALGPYAAGTIEFIIPYDALAEMGLKEEYSYSGCFIAKLLNSSSYSYDLNGDGKEDEIYYYTDYAETADGNLVAEGFLNINGIDLSHINEETIKEFEKYTWSDYMIYDLDSSDETTELVFLSYEAKNGTDDYAIYSNFYRFEQDETLTYLGSVPGDIINPTIDTSNLMP